MNVNSISQHIMDNKGRKTTPLFMKTYSKFQPRGTTSHKPVLSPVFPGDEPSSNNTCKWINIPTGSCEYEISEDPAPVNRDSHQGSNSPGQENFEAIIENKRKQPSKKAFTPLINIKNVLANKPCLSSFKRVSSPFKKGKKPQKNIGQLDSIQESETDSTTTEEEYPVDHTRSRRTSSVSSTSMQSMQVAPFAKQSRKIGPMPGFNLMMVKGNKILPLGTPLASSTALDSGGTSETSEDMEDSSDYELTSPSERSDGSVTVTEEMCSDDDTLTEDNKEMFEEEEGQEEDEIETMRDFPEYSSQLKIRGKRLSLTPKHTTRKYPDNMKIPLERLSLSNNLSSGKKQVSFLLSSKEDQEPHDGVIRKEPFHPPPSILKKSNSESREISFSKSMMACNEKQTRMSSTPTRGGKKDKMMQLSFDVSAVHLPSYDISDLIVENVKGNKQVQNIEVLPPVEIKESNQVGAIKAASGQQDNKVNTTIIECKPPKQSGISTSQPGMATTQQSRTTTQSTSSTHLPVPTIEAQKNTHQPIETTKRTPKMILHPSVCTVQLSTTSGLLDSDMPQVDISIPEDTEDMIEGPIFDSSSLETAPIPSHATPRSQLKRSSPESHVPFTPSKRKYRMKGPSGVTEEIPDIPSSAEHLQRKRLEYQDKRVGPPECCITKIDHSTYRHNGVRVIRYDSNHKMTSKQLQQMPEDVLEVLFA